MPKQRTGYAYYDKKRKTWTARLTYKDELGRTRNVKRQVGNKTEGNLLLKKLLREIEQHGSSIIDGDKLTFARLADIYKDEKLIEPVYEEDDGVRVRVAGLRSYKGERRRLRNLTDHFGARRVVTITHGDILKFKLKRLRDPNKRNAQQGIDSNLKIATVNRELQLMRAVLNFARRKGWIVRNPFELGEPLISMSSERKRDRILTREEEARLLAACETRSRAHVRPILIAALDTGLRKGELLKLKWSDVDLVSGLIRLRATTTKTEQPRTVGMTVRLRAELERLWTVSPRDASMLVFGIKSDIKRGFASACKAAGIEDLRFHDLRHVATTRLVETKALHTAEAMKITGHTQERTFARYVNPQDETARRAAEALDEWLSVETEPERTELIN
ncbi:MAG: integrase [Blastocatellia bacterium]